MLEDASKQIYFSIESPYSESEKNFAKTHYEKQKSKDLKLIYKETPVGSIHTLFLESEFEKTLDLFSEKHELTLPDELQINQNLFDVVIKYFYFKEIPSIAFEEIFDFLNLAFFLKIEAICEKVKGFLKENITNSQKAGFIYHKSNSFSNIFKEDGVKFIKPLIEETIQFLIQQQHFDVFFEIFDSLFFERNSENITDIFEGLLIKMKKSSVSQKNIMKFIKIFRNPLLQQLEIKYEGQSSEIAKFELNFN